MIAILGIYSCHKECPAGDCVPGFQSRYIFYYDTTKISKNDLNYFYLYELDSVGKTIHFEKVYHEFNYNLDETNKNWNNITFADFYKGDPKELSNKILIVKLQDSTYPVRIENTQLRFVNLGGCNPCNQYYLDSLKINGITFNVNTFRLPVKIN